MGIDDAKEWIEIAFLALGAFGIASMWEAVFADVGVCLLAILNCMRILRVKGKIESRQIA
jgi:cation transport ATPase